MVVLKYTSILLVAFLSQQDKPSRLLEDGVTRVPTSFKKIKANKQENHHFFPQDLLYEVDYLTKGNKDYVIPEKNKWNYDFKAYLRLYKNGNLNFFIVLKNNKLNLDSNYNGYRGFYYISESGEINMYIYEKRGEWNINWNYGYNKYFGVQKNDLLFMRNDRRYSGTKLYEIAVYKNIPLKEDNYKADW